MLLLVGCAPLPVRLHETTPAAQVAQETRERELASRTQWTVVAHLGVSNGRDAGSGELEWRQDGEAYNFIVRAPVTGKTWRLAGDAHRAVLEGVDAQPSEDSDAERLLHDHVGWDVPIGALRAWVLGLRAPATAASIRYNDMNLPALLEQDGWKVEYLDWFTDRTPALPRRVFATRGQTRVKLAIETWSFGDRPP